MNYLKIIFFIAITSIATWAGNGQKTDTVSPIKLAPLVEKRDTIYRPGPTPATDKLINEAMPRVDTEAKSFVAETKVDLQKLNTRIAQLEKMWRLEKSRADYLSSITPIHDTTKPVYTITKILFQQEMPDKKDGGKNKKNEKRVYTVRYDTSGPQYISASGLVKR